jgi:hypothetical protein
VDHIEKVEKKAKNLFREVRWLMKGLTPRTTPPGAMRLVYLIACACADEKWGEMFTHSYELKKLLSPQGNLPLQGRPS